VGRAAADILSKGPNGNPGARNYLLIEKGVTFHDLVGWQREVLAAAEPLYRRDGQKLETADVISAHQIKFWQTFEMNV
jgi:hypothetical protein